MKFDIDPWDPQYGTSVEGEMESSQNEVHLDIEVAADAWQAIAVPEAQPGDIVFVDGVRRVEARTWIAAHDGDGSDSEPGVFASYAAGAVRCNADTATFGELEIGRCVVSPSTALRDVEIGSATFRAMGAVDARIESLTNVVHQAMTNAEIRIAERARNGSTALIVVDGPLRERSHVPDAVGLVKTHHVRYLEGHHGAVVAALGQGERTPVFLLQSVWSRYSWYLRLPSFDHALWSGVVRCEASPELSPAVVTELAQRVSAQIVRFASASHKDARAPQNLYPIGALERELRHRMGDTRLIYRALRVASRRDATYEKRRSSRLGQSRDRY